MVETNRISANQIQRHSLPQFYSLPKFYHPLRRREIPTNGIPDPNPAHEESRRLMGEKKDKIQSIIIIAMAWLMAIALILYSYPEN